MNAFAQWLCVLSVFNSEHLHFAVSDASIWSDSYCVVTREFHHELWTKKRNLRTWWWSNISRYNRPWKPRRDVMLIAVSFFKLGTNSCASTALTPGKRSALEGCGKSHHHRKLFLYSLLTLFVLHPYLVLCLDCPAFCTFVFTYNTQHKQSCSRGDSNPQSQ